MSLGRCQRPYVCPAPFVGESLNEEIPADEDTIRRGAESSEHPSSRSPRHQGSVNPRSQSPTRSISLHVVQSLDYAPPLQPERGNHGGPVQKPITTLRSLGHPMTGPCAPVSRGTVHDDLVVHRGTTLM
jgi:hypothetical protein